MHGIFHFTSGPNAAATVPNRSLPNSFSSNSSTVFPNRLRNFLSKGPERRLDIRMPELRLGIFDRPQAMQVRGKRPA
jgi:hypothetical protein